MSNKVDKKIENKNIDVITDTKILCLDDNVLYKRISEINFENIMINDTRKKKVKINIGGDEKLIHIIDINYTKQNKENEIYELLMIIPIQKLLELDSNKRVIKIEINDVIEKKIKELECHLKKIIYDNSSNLFNGKSFSMQKINNALISNIKTKKNDDNTYMKYISFGMNKETEIYEIYKKTGNRNNISNINYKVNKWKKNDEGDIYCKCVIFIENLQFVDNIFTYNLMTKLCEIEKMYNYLYIIKNGEFKLREIDSEESDKLEDEYWDSASI